MRPEAGLTVFFAEFELSAPPSDQKLLSAALRVMVVALLNVMISSLNMQCMQFM